MGMECNPFLQKVLDPIKKLLITSLVEIHTKHKRQTKRKITVKMLKMPVLIFTLVQM